MIMDIDERMKLVLRNAGEIVENKFLEYYNR